MALAKFWSCCASRMQGGVLLKHAALIAAALIALAGCETDTARTAPATSHSIAANPINDPFAVPLIDSEGREGYKDFLRRNFHRAFAIAPDGTWGFDIGRTPDDAVERALSQCQKHTSQTCRLYAVNLCVVYTDGSCVDAPGNLAAGEAAYQRGDYREAMAEFWPLAQAGNAEAQLYLAEGYETNRGVYPSGEHAYRWYMAAAEGGKPYGWYRAGMLARSSSHYPFYDPAKGQALVRMAAERGDPEAQFRLGEWYRLGVDMDVNPEQAVLWYQRAAAQGHKRSQDALSAGQNSAVN